MVYGSLALVESLDDMKKSSCWSTFIKEGKGAGNGE